MEEKSQEDKHLKSSNSKGPHGLGDPEDTFLRKVEKEILIPKLVRERSTKEKCVEEVAAFAKCAKENGLLLTFNCRKEKELLHICLTKWWNNEEFRGECTNQYLHDRSEYRRSGITKKKHSEH